jgi:hypothetical protein
MSTNYALAEGSERGFKQIPGLPKAAGGGTGMLYGDAVAYVRANDRWEKAVAASVKPFGLCGNLEILTQTTDNITGITTTTRGVSDAATSISVIVAGIVKRAADGVIPAGELVMLSATAPLTEVKVWDGVAAAAVFGRYVSNITQHHAADAVPAAADNDFIKVEMIEGSEVPAP